MDEVSIKPRFLFKVFVFNMRKKVLLDFLFSEVDSRLAVFVFNTFDMTLSKKVECILLSFDRDGVYIRKGEPTKGT